MWCDEMPDAIHSGGSELEKSASTILNEHLRWHQAYDVKTHTIRAVFLIPKEHDPS